MGENKDSITNEIEEYRIDIIFESRNIENFTDIKELIHNVQTKKEFTKEAKIRNQEKNDKCSTQKYGLSNQIEDSYCYRSKKNICNRTNKMFSLGSAFYKEKKSLGRISSCA